MERTYYIGGRNGNALIEKTLNNLGWKQIKNKDEAACQLYWCELKSSIDYNAFSEGRQMVNHIPNCGLITNKLNLMNSLQEYERICAVVKKNIKPLDFLPETYKIDEQRDVEKFSAVYKEGEIWICKPTGRNQGRGIFLVRSLKDLEESLMNDTTQDTAHRVVSKPLHRIIQRYISNPLLVGGRKFDIRCYMLIASTVPYLVLYHKGYLRLSMYEYNNNSESIITHLTNQFIQKKDPKYAEVREETAWSMEKFNDYVNNHLAANESLEKDWVLTILPARIKKIIAYIFEAVRNKFQRKIGYFELYGLDFMIDEDMKVWLIEVNINPCLATNCSALKEAVPPVVGESLQLAIECFDKARTNKPLLPLSSQNGFEIIYNEEQKFDKTKKSDKPKSISKPTSSRRRSPTKQIRKSEQGTSTSSTPSTQGRRKSKEKHKSQLSNEKDANEAQGDTEFKSNLSTFVSSGS